jgi:uncharacterized protein YbbC (DUF1343 family)
MAICGLLRLADKRRRITMIEAALCGIDRLEREGFAALKGRRIGLITNHTGLNREGKATVDLLAAAHDCRLTVLFSPEHGIRGSVDAAVKDSVDAATGLPVFSLYGERTRPTAEQVAGLDTMVYDIQDVGTRFYTYISTLGLCLETSAAHHLRFVVLDRPNPIGGIEIEGPLADPDRLDFTAYHPIPVRHGLTVGELARLFAAEKKLNVDLTVIPIENWHRADWWDATNLTWVNPSPNMRSLTQALLYPGIGLLEFTNVSVGRGTDTPFEIVGAPWIRERELAGAMNGRNLPGVRFVPIRFTPQSSVHAQKPCHGVNIIVTDRKSFVPVLTGVALAETLHRLFPQSWESARYVRLLANIGAYESLLSGASAEALVASWQAGIAAFRKRREPILLYS